MMHLYVCGESHTSKLMHQSTIYMQLPSSVLLPIAVHTHTVYQATCQVCVCIPVSCIEGVSVAVCISVDPFGSVLSQTPTEHRGSSSAVCRCILHCHSFWCPLLQYSLPKPKGGRHANNPITIPDQKVTYCQPKKRASKVDVFSPDYMTLSSPFVAHDVTSRGANMAFTRGSSARPRNPNEVRRKGKRKK